ncbi:MAG: isoprenylcysteine carboxylmethyltransferase family protein [bacterium]|nr:isoprenylcysteine carboxylmethyltransferase family protein [bacterium]
MFSEPRWIAVIALALFVVGLLVAFVWRGWLQARRTGDWGIRIGSGNARGAGRLGEVLFAASLLLAVVGLVIAVAIPTWRLLEPGALSWVGLAIAVLGLIAVVASQFSMGASWRVGVDPAEETELVTGGAFAIVRNPIFTAMGVALAGVAMMVPNLAILLSLVLFVVGVQLQVRLVEEPYLLATHGEAYREYARRTGRFLPGLGRGI